MSDTGVVVRDGSSEYTAPDLETVRQWRRENRIGPSAMIFDSSRGWGPLGEDPAATHPAPSGTGRKILFGCLGAVVVSIVGVVVLVVMGARLNERAVREAQPRAAAALKRGNEAFRSSKWAEATVAYEEVVSTVEGSIGSSDDLTQMRNHAFDMLALAHVRAGNREAAARTLQQALKKGMNGASFNAELHPLIEEMQARERRAAEAARERERLERQQARETYLQASRDLLFDLDTHLRFTADLLITVNRMDGDDFATAAANLPKGIRMARDKGQESFDKFSRTPVPDQYKEHAQCLADAWKKRADDYGSLAMWTERADAEGMKSEMNDLKKTVTMIEACADLLNAPHAKR